MGLLIPFQILKMYIIRKSIALSVGEKQVFSKFSRKSLTFDTLCVLVSSGFWHLHLWPYNHVSALNCRNACMMLD